MVFMIIGWESSVQSGYGRKGSREEDPLKKNGLEPLCNVTPMSHLQSN